MKKNRLPDKVEDGWKYNPRNGADLRKNRTDEWDAVEMAIIYLCVVILALSIMIVGGGYYKNDKGVGSVASYCRIDVCNLDSDYT